MKQKVKITEILPKHVFWDMDINKLSIKRDKMIIIPRMLLATNEDTFDKDIEAVETLYSSRDIYETLKQTKERISNNVCRKVSERYHKPLFLRYRI